MIVAVEVDPTGCEVTAKVPELDPAGTVSVEGTVATVALLEERVIGNPPVGAGPLRVTVAWESAPEVTEVGLRVRAVRVGGLTVSVAEKDVAPSVALITGEVTAATAKVVTVAVPVV